MSERIFGSKGKLTSLIGPVFVVLMLAVSCTGAPAEPLPGASSATNAPAPTQTQPPVYNSATASPQPADTLVPTVIPTVVPTVIPTVIPTVMPTVAPTAASTDVPTVEPLVAPTAAPTDAPAASNATASEIRNFALENLTIVAGTTVTWTNRDGPSHTATSGTPQEQDGIWDSQVLSGGGTFSFTFNEPGMFPYFCRIHNSMRATVTVSG